MIKFHDFSPPVSIISNFFFHLCRCVFRLGQLAHLLFLVILIYLVVFLLSVITCLLYSGKSFKSSWFIKSVLCLKHSCDICALFHFYVFSLLHFRLMTYPAFSPPRGDGVNVPAPVRSRQQSEVMQLRLMRELQVGQPLS